MPFDICIPPISNT